MNVKKSAIKSLTELIALKALQKARKTESSLQEADYLKQIAELNKKLQMLKNDFDDLKTNYEAHKHSYMDVTIADTADGTGTLCETTKQTTTKV
jgi:hypothetical protein